MRRKGWTAVKKMVCTAAVLVLLLMNAAALPELGALHAKSAALYAANGQELYVSNADEKLQPASVTKIMTMLLAMEALERGEVTLDTMITGSEHACSMGGTQIWLEPGEQLTLDEMLKAIAVGSANDCAVAVAEHLAGTEAAFVERMNARARELGCTGTTFINANGLDGEGERTLTTARDLALISCELLRHPKILDYTGIWMDSIRGGKFALANTNKMLRSYKGPDRPQDRLYPRGWVLHLRKRGTEELSLVAVVMAAPTREDRMADAAALLNYGFANFTAWTPPEESCAAVPVTLGRADTVALRMEGDSVCVLEKSAVSTVEAERRVPESLTAPVEEGQQVGELIVRNGGETLLTVPLCAAESVEAVTVFDLFGRFVRSVTGTGA